MTDFASKPRLNLLDGLRGVAALIVVVYHLFECFDLSPIPRGYLAVDFFFVLSGFVIGYSYDDRWPRGLSAATFFRRRLIRLHPLVIAGAVIGAVCFIAQGGTRWDGSSVSWTMIALATVANLLMIPLWPSAAADVRGNGEMFPLNGPNWSLFFEYIGNILYAILLRRMPTLWLALIAAAAGAGIVFIAITDGYLGVGWTMANGGLWQGTLRMLFSYVAGMLIARCHPKVNMSRQPLTCMATLLTVSVLPLTFGEMPVWASGLYDAVCVMAVFPALVIIGASSTSRQSKPLKLLGELSYPLYAVHYPLMYLFYAYIGFNGNLVPIARLEEVWPVAVALPFVAIILAWAVMKWWDNPIRRRLSGRRVRN